MSTVVGVKSKFRVASVVILSICVGLVALYDLLNPASSGCAMTYMYPTYIPISSPANVSFDKYGLFLYHEGWKQIDFKEHLKKLSGVPVLFIPGNGGSYKQVRSLAAESFRAFQGGPLDPTFYKEAAYWGDEPVEELDSFSLPRKYNKMLDWFAVDLEGEHSAMDGRILEEHAEYVVYAIHKILDQYKESQMARSKEGADASESLPTSVILVGHSMGGFVARAAIVHPHLRKSSVETVLTLSSPHQSPPLALQPSLGHYFSQVNLEWQKGYQIQTNHAGHVMATPKLSQVVVVSISGGILDYQVRTKLSSLDGIVPPSHGFMMSSSSMKNAWLTMDHQSILWCNQVVVQISHTILSIIDPFTGQPFPKTWQRLFVFSKMFQSGIPQSFNWMVDKLPPRPSLPTSGLVQGDSCPAHLNWVDDGLEKDLYIQSATVTVLAMDGRRRWLDINKLGSNGTAHFAFVTNLAPCSGVRLHLWPEKSKLPYGEGSAAREIIEVTSKMVHIPSGPAPRQIEPGSQTEQAPPSSVFWLTPEDMHGFRFLTISVAPRPTVSGRPPPAASMAVGQFFNPKEGETKFSSWLHVHSSYIKEGIFVNEDHPLALNLSYPVSLGLLPIALSVQTVGCGIKNSALPFEQAGDVEQNSLCKLRCFPPVALAWDYTSGLHVIPNLYNENVVVDSSPTIWDLNRATEGTTVLLLVDPHCSYKIISSVSWTTAAGRLFLSYSSQMAGFVIAVIFFALMRQARAWELDVTVPSILTAIDLNLRAPIPFILLAVVPLIFTLVLSFVNGSYFTPAGSLVVVSLMCYLVANGFAIILVLCSKFVLYMAASAHVFVKIRWQAWQGNACLIFLHRIFNFSSLFYSLKVVRILKGNPKIVIAFATIPLVCFVHPAIGLLVLLLYDAYCCHAALCSFLAASFRSHAQQNNGYYSGNNDQQPILSKSQQNVASDPLLPLDDNISSNPSWSYGDTQIEIFNYQLGVLILHLTAASMFVPSLVAWLQRIGMSQSLPWFIDSVLCMGVIMHGLSGWKPDISSLKFRLPRIHGKECGLSLVYLLSGYYTYISALASAPYKAFYAMAFVGVISVAARFVDREGRDKSDSYLSNRRKDSHKL